MVKVKLADKREIPRIPLKQISVERVGSPYLTRVEQQHVRSNELGFSKISNFEDTDVAPFSITSATVTSNFFNALVSAVPGEKIKVLTEMNIYVGTDADPNYLWPTGASLTSSQKNIIVTVLPQVVGSALAPNEEGSDGVSGLSSPNVGKTLGLHQQRIGFNFRNQSADTHTYYLYLRFVVIRL
jgi:hypothetical protein